MGGSQGCALAVSWLLVLAQARVKASEVKAGIECRSECRNGDARIER